MKNLIYFVFCLYVLLSSGVRVSALALGPSEREMLVNEEGAEFRTPLNLQSGAGLAEVIACLQGYAPDNISDDMTLADLTKYLSDSKQDLDLEEVKRSLSLVTRFQLTDFARIVAELIDNVRDEALRRGVSSPQVDLVTLPQTLEVRDSLGMTLKELIFYLNIPTQSKNALGAATGRFGQGFLSVFYFLLKQMDMIVTSNLIQTKVKQGSEEKVLCVQKGDHNGVSFSLSNRLANRIIVESKKEGSKEGYRLSYCLDAKKELQIKVERVKLWDVGTRIQIQSEHLQKEDLERIRRGIADMYRFDESRITWDRYLLNPLGTALMMDEHERASKRNKPNQPYESYACGEGRLLIRKGSSAGEFGLLKVLIKGKEMVRFPYLTYGRVGEVVLDFPTSIQVTPERGSLVLHDEETQAFIGLVLEQVNSLAKDDVQYLEAFNALRPLMGESPLKGVQDIKVILNDKENVDFVPDLPSLGGLANERRVLMNETYLNRNMILKGLDSESFGRVDIYYDDSLEMDFPQIVVDEYRGRALVVMKRNLLEGDESMLRKQVVFLNQYIREFLQSQQYDVPVEDLLRRRVQGSEGLEKSEDKELATMEYEQANEEGLFRRYSAEEVFAVFSDKGESLGENEDPQKLFGSKIEELYRIQRSQGSFFKEKREDPVWISFLNDYIFQEEIELQTRSVDVIVRVMKACLNVIGVIEDLSMNMPGFHITDDFYKELYRIFQDDKASFDMTVLRSCLKSMADLRSSLRTPDQKALDTFVYRSHLLERILAAQDISSLTFEWEAFDLHVRKWLEHSDLNSDSYDIFEQDLFDREGRSAFWECLLSVMTKVTQENSAIAILEHFVNVENTLEMDDLREVDKLSSGDFDAFYEEVVTHLKNNEATWERESALFFRYYRLFKDHAYPVFRDRDHKDLFLDLVWAMMNMFDSLQGTPLWTAETDSSAVVQSFAASTLQCYLNAAFMIYDDFITDMTNAAYQMDKGASFTFTDLQEEAPLSYGILLAAFPNIGVVSQDEIEIPVDESPVQRYSQIQSGEPSRSQKELKQWVTQHSDRYRFLYEVLKNSEEHKKTDDSDKASIFFSTHTDKDGHLILEIQDNGVGMDEEGLETFYWPKKSRKGGVQSDRSNPNFGVGALTLFHYAPWVRVESRTDQGQDSSLRRLTLQRVDVEGGMDLDIQKSVVTNDSDEQGSGTRIMLKLKTSLKPSLEIAVLLHSLNRFAHNVPLANKGRINIYFNDVPIQRVNIAPDIVVAQEPYGDQGERVSVRICSSGGGVYHHNYRISDLSSEDYFLVSPDLKEMFDRTGYHIAIDFPKEAGQYANRTQFVDADEWRFVRQRFVVVAMLRAILEAMKSGRLKETQYVDESFWHVFENIYEAENIDNWWRWLNVTFWEFQSVRRMTNILQEWVHQNTPGSPLDVGFVQKMKWKEYVALGETQASLVKTFLSHKQNLMHLLKYVQVPSDSLLSLRACIKGKLIQKGVLDERGAYQMRNLEPDLKDIKNAFDAMKREGRDEKLLHLFQRQIESRVRHLYKIQGRYGFFKALSVEEILKNHIKGLDESDISAMYVIKNIYKKICLLHNTQTLSIKLKFCPKGGFNAITFWGHDGYREIHVNILSESFEALKTVIKDLSEIATPEDRRSYLSQHWFEIVRWIKTLEHEYQHCLEQPNQLTHTPEFYHAVSRNLGSHWPRSSEASSGQLMSLLEEDLVAADFLDTSA